MGRRGDEDKVENFYEFELGAEGRLKRLFWPDAGSQRLP